VWSNSKPVGPQPPPGELEHPLRHGAAGHLCRARIWLQVLHWCAMAQARERGTGGKHGTSQKQSAKLIIPSQSLTSLFNKSNVSLFSS